MAYPAQRRLRLPQELPALRDELLDWWRVPRRALYVYEGTCQARQAQELASSFAERIGQASRTKAGRDVSLLVAGCHGLCSAGPTAYVSPPGVFYVNLSCEDVGAIVRQTLGEGKIIDDLTFWDQATGRHIPLKRDIPFLARQTRRLLRNCGEVNPHRIEDSLRRGGYLGLARALDGMFVRDIISEVAASGLRGRGEFHGSCAEKWTTFVEAAPRHRSLTAYMKGWETAAASDCVLLEGDPHLVLEGMAIAALATGCEEGRLLLPPGREMAVQLLSEAAEQACAYGLLGENILGTNFSFSVEVKSSPPQRRVGWRDEASELSHNVETLANLPWTLSRGAEDFRSVGSPTCPGTILVSLGGELCYRGVVEVPGGTPVLEVVEDFGGGGRGETPLHSVALGGPRGRLVPVSRLRTPPAVMVEAGASDVVAFDARDDVVRQALAAAKFVANESCGRCVPCRIGTKRIEEILDRMCRDEAAPSALADLRDLGEVLSWTGGCPRGRHGADCLLSALDAFEEEFLAHLPGGQCPAKACLVSRAG